MKLFKHSEIVLILIVMEDALRDPVNLGHNAFTKVLILIVMEDALRVYKAFSYKEAFTVLILIVMEDALRELIITLEKGKERLNPYCNGRCS